MSIPFTKYCQVKNKYCLAYYGKDRETLLSLINIRPAFQQKFPELSIFIACRDDLYSLIENNQNIIKESELVEENFGYIRRLELNSRPLEALAAEANW